MSGSSDDQKQRSVRRSMCAPPLSVFSDSLFCFFREGVKEDHSASYFSNDNKSARELRNRLAEESLNALIKWLKEGGNVAIHGRRTFSGIEGR